MSYLGHCHLIQPYLQVLRKSKPFSTLKHNSKGITQGNCISSMNGWEGCMEPYARCFRKCFRASSFTTS